MKTLFTFLTLVLSISAFAVEKQDIACNVGVSGNQYVEMQYFFPTPTSVIGYVVIDDVKIPTPTNEVETTEELRIVTNSVGLPNIHTISVELPVEIFTNEGRMVYFVPATVNERNVWAACINY